MLDIFRGLKSLIKVNHIKTDSPVFRLHYSITVMILMSFSLIVTTRQYVGNPIDCIHTKDVPEDVLNTFCWIHSTYTMKHLFTKKVGEEVAYPGVGTSQLEKMGNIRPEPKIYRYYQWVCFCLFFQVKTSKNFSLSLNLNLQIFTTNLHLVGATDFICLTNKHRVMCSYTQTTTEQDNYPVFYVNN